eukprot:scaffold78748_cov17-Prasinocladus_malaysianus.AAC.1
MVGSRQSLLPDVYDLSCRRHAPSADQAALLASRYEPDLRPALSLLRLDLISCTVSKAGEWLHKHLRHPWRSL